MDFAALVHTIMWRLHSPPAAKAFPKARAGRWSMMRARW